MSTLAKFIATLGLTFYYVAPSIGNIILHETEVPPSMACEYRYNTQPAQSALSCNALTIVVLQCQVTSDRNNFSISWHYSTFEPDSSNIHDHGYTGNGIISTDSEQNNMTLTSTSVTSELTLREFSENENGFYWCSVESNGTTLPNPSVVLHVLHHSSCASATKEESKECNGQVHFYSLSSTTIQCADQNTTVSIVEAQNCTNEDEKQSEFATTMSIPLTTDSESDMQTSYSQNINGSDTQHTEAPTMTDLSTLPQLFGIIIGASMGGLVLILTIIIGLLLVCLVRMRAKRQEREQRDDSSSPHHYDDIRTHTSVSLTDKDIMGTTRISKIPLELNVSYECICPQANTSQANDNVYDCIQ